MTEDDGTTSAFTVRRVVTGVDATGGPRIESDGGPPETVGPVDGPALSELWWLPGMPATAHDGGEIARELRGRFPENGAITARLIRFPGFAPGTPVDQTWLRVPGDDPAVPGMHRSETLDLMVVLDGFITLGLDDGEHPLGPGDVVIQRGTLHRWRVVGERPCTFLSVLLAPVAGMAPARLEFQAGVADALVRRVVTGTLPDGGSAVVADGPPATSLGGGSTRVADLWHTGGPLRSVEQGGDSTGPWQLEPPGGGVSLRRVDFGPGHDPGPAGWHATATVDIDVLLSGRLEMALAAEGGEGSAEKTVLTPGDVVIQRGTRHRWRPIGDEAAVLYSVMIAVTSG